MAKEIEEVLAEDVEALMKAPPTVEQAERELQMLMEGYIPENAIKLESVTELKSSGANTLQVDWTLFGLFLVIFLVVIVLGALRWYKEFSRIDRRRFNMAFLRRRRPTVSTEIRLESDFVLPKQATPKEKDDASVSRPTSEAVSQFFSSLSVESLAPSERQQSSEEEPTQLPESLPSDLFDIDSPDVSEFIKFESQDMGDYTSHHLSVRLDMLFDESDVLPEQTSTPAGRSDDK